MTRRRTGRSRDGLFEWTGTSDVQAAEVASNPLLRACPACGAPPRQRCTKPTRRGGGRRDADPHPSRIDATGPAVDQPSIPVLPPSVHAQPSEEFPT